jgi:signal recognition particle GTPase
MGDASKFFEENILGLSDPEKYNLYSGLSEVADDLSALHDQMNKLSEMPDGLSALHDQMNKLSEMPDKLSALPDQMNRLEAVLASMGRDMRELRKSVRVRRRPISRQSPKGRFRLFALCPSSFLPA